MLTLKQAAAVAQDEYDAEIRSWNDQQGRAADKINNAETDDLADTVAQVLFSVAGRVDLRALCSICIRFGMRIQRKLDNPGDTTTVYCGASTESDGREN